MKTYQQSDVDSYPLENVTETVDAILSRWDSSVKKTYPLRVSLAWVLGWAFDRQLPIPLTHKLSFDFLNAWKSMSNADPRAVAAEFINALQRKIRGHADAIVSPDDTISVIDGMRSHIDSQIAEKTTVVVPIFHVETKSLDDDIEDGETSVLTIAAINGVEGESEKQAIAKVVAETLFSDRRFPLFVAFCHEAWVSSHENLDTAKAAGRPADDPQRREALMVSGLSMKRESWTDVLLFARDEHEIIIPDPNGWQGLRRSENPLLDCIFVEYSQLLLASAR